MPQKSRLVLPEAPLLQNPYAFNGAAAGGAYRVLQRARMPVGGKKDFCRPFQGHGRVVQSFCSGQAAGNTAVGHGLQHQIDIGRAAAGEGAGRVNKPLLQRIQQAAGAHIRHPVGSHILCHQVIGAVRNHTFAHSGGGVGHNTYNRQPCSDELLNSGDFQPSRHGDEQRLFLCQRTPQGKKQLPHHMGLYRKKNAVTVSGNRCIIGIH